MGKGHMVVTSEPLRLANYEVMHLFHHFIDKGKVLQVKVKPHVTVYYLEHPDFIGDNENDEYILEYKCDYDVDKRNVQLSRLKMWSRDTHELSVVKVYN